MSSPLTIARDARAHALAAGLATYTGQACIRGHVTRYTSNRACVECAKSQRRAQLAKRRAANQQKGD